MKGETRNDRGDYLSGVYSKPPTDEIPKTSVGKYDKIAIRKKMDVFLEKAKKPNEA